MTSMSLFLNPAPLRTRTTIQSVHFIETITFFPLLREYLYLDLRRKGHVFRFSEKGLIGSAKTVFIILLLLFRDLRRKGNILSSQKVTK
jgi:hypothetical protein